MTSAGSKPPDLAICKHFEGFKYADSIKVLCCAQNRDLVVVVEEVFEELTSQPHLSGEGQQITVLELGVINSEHFPFNVSKYATTFPNSSSATY